MLSPRVRPCRRLSAASSPSPSPSPCTTPSQTHSPSPRTFSALAISALLLSYLAVLAVPVAAEKNITLTYLDDSGAALGQPQAIFLTACSALNTASFIDGPTEGNYSSVTTSETHAALNLYADSFCQVLMSSAVGRWNNTAPVANMLAIRWEGKAPDTFAPGTLSPDAWPPGMVVQTQVPNVDGDASMDGITFQLDPSKGRIVVGLVSVVLIIGVIIGALQVWNAAQYVPPPKVRGNKSQVGGKKVKKKEAYYKKPAKDDQSSTPLAATGVGGGMVENGSNRSSLALHMMQERAGSERLVATLSSSTVDYPHDAVLIDIQESTPSTPSLRRPWNQTGRASPSGSSITAADLIQFGNDGSPSGSHYQTSTNTSSSSPGRGGEVLVPMHTLGRRQSPTQWTDRSQ